MKAINIYLLSKIQDCSEFSLYERRLSMRPQPLTVREHERESLASFISCAYRAGASLCDFDSFYYSYSIPQIGKEFDLLKITPECILNIELLNYYRAQNYTFINYTPSLYYPSTLDQYPNSLSTHSVIGQEFDNVIMILDDHFAYDNEKKLRAVRHPNPDYLYRKMLIQGVTRVREKLCLLVVNNKPIFQEILAIL